MLGLQASREILESSWLRVKSALQLNSAYGRAPIIIVSHPRSGGNLLAYTLNHLPRTHFFGELLSPQTPNGLDIAFRGKRALSHLCEKMNAAESAHYGFKLPLHHLHQRGIRVADLVSTFPYARYLICYRRDLLMAFLSNQIAQKTGQWMVSATSDLEGASPKVIFQPDEYRWFRKHVTSEYSQLLSEENVSRRSLLVSYEDLDRNIDSVFKSDILPFVGLAWKKEIRPALKKLRTYRRPEEAVENTDDLTPFLAPEHRFFEPQVMPGIEGGCGC